MQSQHIDVDDSEEEDILPKVKKSKPQAPAEGDISLQMFANNRRSFTKGILFVYETVRCAVLVQLLL